MPGGWNAGLPAVDKESSTLTFFPNPANEVFSLSITFADNQSGDGIIEVIDILGNLVHSQETTVTKGNLQQEIQLGNIANGIYQVKLIMHDHTYTAQINIQK